MRKPFIAGNWKMNLSLSEALDLVIKLTEKEDEYCDVEVAVASPFPYLYEITKILKEKNSSIKLFAQNVSNENNGAFTGEISTSILRCVNINSVIIGHSERRTLYHESDQEINKKVLKALNDDFNVILCVGETLEERNTGKAVEIVKSQIIKGLMSVDVSILSKLVIAYEPVWAIGTGMTASNEDAEEMHKMIRVCIKELYGSGISDTTRILYGGSVKPENIDGLMQQENIDGALVGGASLKADSFLRIINFNK